MHQGACRAHPLWEHPCLKTSIQHQMMQWLDAGGPQFEAQLCSGRAVIQGVPSTSDLGQLETREQVLQGGMIWGCFLCTKWLWVVPKKAVVSYEYVC